MTYNVLMGVIVLDKLAVGFVAPVLDFGITRRTVVSSATTARMSNLEGQQYFVSTLSSIPSWSRIQYKDAATMGAWVECGERKQEEKA